MGTNKKNGKPDPLDAASFVIGNWYRWGAIDFPFMEVTKKQLLDSSSLKVHNSRRICFVYDCPPLKPSLASVCSNDR